MAGLNASVCFFPDGATTGATTSPVQVPCNPLAPDSACCPIGASCVGNGLCYSNHGGIMRGSCTDSKWLAPECATVCKDRTGFMTGSQTSYTWLTQCNFAVSEDDFRWECGLAQTCTEDAWPLAIGGIEHMNISGLAADPILKWTPDQTSLTTLPTSNTPGPTQCPPQAGSTDGNAPGVSPIVVGAGIAVPLGLLFLAALSSTLWYRRKWVQARNMALTHQFGQGFQRVGTQEPKWELDAKHAIPAQFDEVLPAIHEMGEPTGDMVPRTFSWRRTNLGR